MKKLFSTLTEELESQLDPDFFQDKSDVQRKAKTITKYKIQEIRNLLTNVSYRRYKSENVQTLFSRFFRF